MTNIFDMYFGILNNARERWRTDRHVFGRSNIRSYRVLVVIEFRGSKPLVTEGLKNVQRLLVERPPHLIAALERQLSVFYHDAPVCDRAYISENLRTLRKEYDVPGDCLDQWSNLELGLYPNK
ncbi:MAG TPA: hypothetical protein VHA78_02735 [Candidatus Peribacteraceae bacterium]|nr:hypothetical protein [Candidatus Peribacteraceae bacterium]